MKSYFDTIHLLALRHWKKRIMENIDKLSSMRVPYLDPKDALDENMFPTKDPMKIFQNWFDEACHCPEIKEPNAMCLSTCNKYGYPSGRFVLLKGMLDRSFIFYTNYHSRKGSDLVENPLAALTFYWEPFKRQVRIEGIVEKLSEEESTKYFHERPRASQISACASRQSTKIPDRKHIIDLEKGLLEKYGKDLIIPRPEDWGGYKVNARLIEFWQGQSNRLHDRIQFRLNEKCDDINEEVTHRGESDWVYERLAP